MAGSGKNFLSLLDDEKVSIFCAYDKDYSGFKGKICSENLFSHLGFEGIEKCVFMEQFHSNLVEIYSENSMLFKCDGLMSDKKGIALCVLSADCLPLILYHKNGFIAALHSGRKGSFENILKKCCDKFDKKLDLSEMKLFILPAISFENYEIGGEILDFTRLNFKDFLVGNKLDLKALVKFQAKNLGIKDVEDSEICTFKDDRFFSYRKDKTQKRFVSVVYLKA